MLRKNSKKSKPEDPKGVAGEKKVGFDHVPMSGFLSLAVGMKPGADKYGRKNWHDVKELSMVTYLNAMMRHWLLLQAGEDYVRDADGYVHHLDAIASSCAILRDIILQGRCNDERVKLDDESLTRFAREMCGDEYADLPIKKLEDK